MLPDQFFTANFMDTKQLLKELLASNLAILDILAQASPGGPSPQELLKKHMAELSKRQS